MATTTNYGWTTPDDTALVKDGAAAIRTLGTSVDTTTKNLNPSTTLGDIEYRSSTSNTNTRLAIGSSGQGLIVVAGVPSWAASSTSVLTTTGDTLYASAANTLARLGIGSTGQVLTVASGVPSWATPTAPAAGLTLINTTTFSGVSSQSVNSVFTSTYRNYKILFDIQGTTAAQTGLRLRASGTDNTGSDYNYDFGTAGGSTNDTSFRLMRTDNGLGGSAVVDVFGPQVTYKTVVNTLSTGNDGGVDGYPVFGQINVTTGYDGFTIFPNSGTITGRFYVYGYGI
jgi:hypothetical protein